MKRDDWDNYDRPPEKPKKGKTLVGEWYKLATKLKKYGLKVPTFEKMLKTQNEVCAICKNPCKTGKMLAVDHCHDTGAVRGLLCTKCNVGIGMMNDDPKRLRAAIDYLENAIDWREQ